MLIIDMPMPKFCIWCDDKNETRRCPLLNEDDNCVLQDSNIWMSWNEQYAHCPIKGELPDEHGDLIDRDALLEKYNKKGVNIAECLTDERTANAFEKYCIIADAVEAAETVIAAERKDDEQIH